MKLFNIPDNIHGGVMSPWLSDTSVLRFGDDGKLYSFDITNRIETCLEAFTEQVQSSPAFIVFLDTSPDGKFAMWGRSGGNPIFAAPIDGAYRHQWPSPNGMTNPHWCADSKYIAQIAFSGDEYEHGEPIIRFDKVDFRNAETGDLSETITDLPEGLQGLEILAVVSASHVVARVPDQRENLGSIPTSTSSFLGAYKVTARSRQEVSVWDLHGAAPLHRWIIDLPGEVASVAVTPDGERAAWITRGTGESTSWTKKELWVSAIDGTQMREVAMEVDSMIGVEMCWSPNSKMLSIVAERKFHVVEVAEWLLS